MKGQLLFWKVFVSLLAIFSVSLCLFYGACKYRGVSNEDQMRADVKRLVDAAMGHEMLWPWEASMTEVHKVAAYGKAIAPMLLELLCNKPDEDFNCVESRVQQHAALALCEIYNVQPLEGHIYMNRALIADNDKVKAFWTEMIAKGGTEKEKNKAVTKYKEIEKTYKEQLMLFNDQIHEENKKYYNSRSFMAKVDDEGQDVVFRMAQQKKDTEQSDRSLKELVEKRRALKKKVIEQFGSVPSWWTETNSPTEE
jgi:hypothetical protein